MYFKKVGEIFFCIFGTNKICNIIKKTNTEKTRCFCKFKKFAWMGILALKKADTLQGKRGCVAVTVHIFTFLLVGTNSCLTVYLL
jgi:hypothetical protein